MYVANSSADLFWLHSQFSRCLSSRSSKARPVFGLMTLPTSNTPTQREILTSPVSLSTRTSQN